MSLVSDLDLPVSDYAAPGSSAGRYRQQLAETSRPGWLARSPRAVDEVPRFEPVTPYGIDKLPIIWSGSAQVGPDDDAGPGVA